MKTRMILPSAWCFPFEDKAPPEAVTSFNRGEPDAAAANAAKFSTDPQPAAAPGHPQRRTHDSTRHATTTVFAALEVATGRVTDQCFDRHRHSEFLAFLKLVAKGLPTMVKATRKRNLGYGH
jgi:hypothetical protein